jgi:hypothetical protein
MSILVYQGSVILSGDITEDDTYFRTADAMASKVSFPTAVLLPLTPPSAGRWGYVNDAFVDLDVADANAAQAVQDEINAQNVDEAVKVRQTRAALLAASDWTQVADAPVDKTAWATYRQALRDIPSQSGFPRSVTWPNKP